jgi:hypothetical protein
MEDKYDFRFSDSDLAAYLVVLGYEPSYVEVVVDKKHSNRLKGFIHFIGDRDDFIKLQEEYKNNKVEINLLDFSLARQRINKIVKSEISKCVVTSKINS